MLLFQRGPNVAVTWCTIKKTSDAAVKNRVLLPDVLSSSPPDQISNSILLEKYTFLYHECVNKSD